MLLLSPFLSFSRLYLLVLLNNFLINIILIGPITESMDVLCICSLTHGLQQSLDVLGYLLHDYEPLFPMSFGCLKTLQRIGLFDRSVCS